MLWKDATIVAFDTETTGAYPLGSEVCEIAAVKWRAGQVVGRFESFIRPSKPMGQAVINIHHITNEMVADAPRAAEVFPEFLTFVADHILVAHHAQFDLGFIAPTLEQLRLPFPTGRVFCSSLLARKLIRGTVNHKLQTLIKAFEIPAGPAHRALSDAEAGLEVALRCFHLAGENATLDEIEKIQGAPLPWDRFGILALQKDEKIRQLVESILQEAEVQIVYRGGSRPGQARTVKPLGIVRNLDGDYLAATDGPDPRGKRYLLDKITAARP